jgi:NDP-sugar pyrophosphorylase family protein
MNGDLLMDVRFDSLLARHVDGGLTVLIADKTVKIDLGVLEIDAAGLVTDYIEKPEYSYKVSTGVYVFSRGVVNDIASGEHLDLPDLVKRRLAAGAAVRPVELSEVGSLWLDLGRIEDYEEGRRVFEGDPRRFLPAGE